MGGYRSVCFIGFRESRRSAERHRVGRLAWVCALLCALFVIAPGCAFHIGSDGLDMVFAGTYYGHTDKQAGKDAVPQRWTTHAARTWGTSGIEGKITTDSETISIQGEGISAEMSATLGNDVIATVADQVSCALQPAQAKCIPTKSITDLKMIDDLLVEDSE